MNAWRWIWCLATLTCCTATVFKCNHEQKENPFRLPKDLYPVRYDITISPDMYDRTSDTFGTFRGDEVIRFRADKDTDKIVLHQDGLDITHIKIQSLADNTTLAHTSVTYDEERNFLTIPLSDNTFSRGSEYTVQFEWTGTMRNDSLGLYLSHYETAAGDTVYLATTQMEATFARTAFPCFDEPFFRSVFSINIERRTDTDRNYKAMFNAPLFRSEPADRPGWIKDVFGDTPKMPAYLVAFIVSDFEELDTGYVDGIRFTTHARPDRVEEATLGHLTGLDALDWLQRNFAPSFRDFLPKIDSASLPDFNAGAMENWGMITYNKDFLYQAGRDQVWKPYWIVGTVVHELIHQWFGNIVTPKWWDSLWLSEGLTTYFSYYVVDKLYPDSKEGEIKVSYDVMDLMRDEAQEAKHPLTCDLQTPTEIKARFDGIEYKKGGAIARMMHMVMGEHFLPALMHYLTKNQLRSVEFTDLLDALDEYGNTMGHNFSMSSRMRPWILQSGYPVIQVQRKGPNVLLEQHQFLFKRHENKIEVLVGLYGNKYDIPVQMISSVQQNSTGSSDVFWLDRDSPPPVTVALKSTEAKADWIALNPQHKGYYRVNYDRENWRHLSQQLVNDPHVFDPLLRATFIDDSFSLVQAGMLDLGTALDTTLYLGQELSYAGWRAFSRHYLRILRLTRGSSAGDRFEAFVRDIAGKAGAQLTFDVSSDIPPYNIYVRTWVVKAGCGSGEAFCVDTATQLVERWRKSNSNPINLNFRFQFYCAALRSRPDLYTFIYNAAYDAFERGDIEAREALIHAQTCSPDKELLKWTLETSMDINHYLSSNSLDIIDWVSENRVGKELAFDFLVDNIDRIQELVGIKKTMDRAVAVTRYLTRTNNEDLARLQHLKRVVRAAFGRSPEWHETLENIKTTIRDNDRWLRLINGHLVNWLNKAGY